MQSKCRLRFLRYSLPSVFDVIIVKYIVFPIYANVMCVRLLVGKYMYEVSIHTIDRLIDCHV